MEKAEEINSKIMILGLLNFPYGFAEIQRAILLSKAFMLAGNKICIIGKMSRKASDNRLDISGNFNDIPYILTSKKFQKEKILRIVNKPIEKCREISYIRRFAKYQHYRLAFVSSNNFCNILLYYILGRLFDFKLIFNYVEYYSAIEHSNVPKKINNILIDRFVPKFADAFIPISDYIAHKIGERTVNKPIIKIPILCDPERFFINYEPVIEKYFCYCGSTNYFEVADFIIDAYKSILNKKGFKLFLIISGDKRILDKLRLKTQSDNLSDAIKIYSDIPSTEYNKLLINAAALLIPLRNTIQDIARFPHKIGEYSATANPIIATDMGEISAYFKDMENAMLCRTFDRVAFSEKMELVIQNQKVAADIGMRGRDTCQKYFDFRRYREPLKRLTVNLK